MTTRLSPRNGTVPAEPIHSWGWEVWASNVWTSKSSGKSCKLERIPETARDRSTSSCPEINTQPFFEARSISVNLSLVLESTSDYGEAA